MIKCHICRDKAVDVWVLPSGQSVFMCVRCSRPILDRPKKFKKWSCGCDNGNKKAKIYISATLPRS